MAKLAKKYSSRHTHSHAILRKAIGWVAILLPFVLSLGCIILFKEDNLRKSISDYHHSQMDNVFVGTLCAVAMFMFYDTGYNIRDDWAGNLAGIFAFGVAWFPPSQSDCFFFRDGVHLVSAILLFVTLAITSLFLFPKMGKKFKSTVLTRNRKFIYRFCGIAIFACLISMGIYYLCYYQEGSKSTIVFWVESIALVMFGISWLTSGYVLSRVKR